MHQNARIVFPNCNRNPKKPKPITEAKANDGTAQDPAALAMAIMRSRRKDLKQQKVEKRRRPPKVAVSNTGTIVKGAKVAPTPVLRAQRNRTQVAEVPALVSEPLPVGWVNPELPPAGTFEALASIKVPR